MPEPTSRLRVTGASTIAIDAETEHGGELLAVDGRIAAADEGGASSSAAERETEVLDATGGIVTPGLVNAHHHLLQSAFRTIPATRGVPMSAWLPAMAGAYAAAGMDPELFACAASVGVAEGLLCGVTTVADHHLNWPHGAPIGDTVAIAEAIVGSARALGGRLVYVRGSARDDADWAGASAEAIAAELLPAGDGDLHHNGGITLDGMLQYAVGPAGVHSDGEDTFAALASVAAKHGLRRRTQANEQVDVAIALERYGRRPIDLLDGWGWLAPEVTIAHLVGVTAEERARLAAAGVSATHAPGCDVPMGWGVAEVAELLDAGIPVGLGTSGGGSNDAGHLLADARLAMQVSGLTGRPLSARTALALATSGSAAGLGRPELGHLRPGAAADFCVWDTGGVADAGVADPVAGLLWTNPGRRPRHVVVAGRVVVRDYALITADERELAGQMRRLLAARGVG